MKRIHILQHVPYETPGCIENWIKEKSYESSVTKLFNGEKLPEVSAIDWLIVMGGPMSVHDTESFPWLSDEKRFIKESIKSGKIVIGICLGSQLIAEVLGSKVYKNLEKEIGWFPVTRISKAADSSVLKKFNETETVFHWHGDTFDLPEDSIHLFESAACRNQCFIYNERVLGLQFHVEVTTELLDEMLINGHDEMVPARYIQNPDEITKGSSFIKRNNELMFSILDEMDII